MTGPAAEPPPEPRLTVRPWREEDAAEVNRAVAESLEHLRPFMPWASEPPMSVADRLAWVAERTAAGDRLYGAWDADGALVASGGLHPRIGPGGLELGYWVHAAHVRRRVATALARRLVQIAFADPAVTHLEIRHDVANAPSGRVAARVGFTAVGEVDKPAVAPGESGRDRIWRLDRGAAAQPPHRAPLHVLGELSAAAGGPCRPEAAGFRSLRASVR